MQSLEEVLPGSPRVYSRQEHAIRLRDIDPDALKVVRRLDDCNHLAFIVGGGVRDLLLKKTPKDFDIATDASTSRVKTIFKNSRVIGKRFKLNQVYFKGGKIFEVSSFRDSKFDSKETEEIVMLGSDNTFGTAETDAFRRDITINALFFDCITNSIIDYVGGFSDLEKGVIKIIGHAPSRIKEDPVRIIRAIRHAARANFVIEANTWDAICEYKNLLEFCPKVRIFDELCRDVLGGFSAMSFALMREAGLLKQVVTPIGEAIDRDLISVWQRLEDVLVRIDSKIRSGIEVPLYVAFSALIIAADDCEKINPIEDPINSLFSRYSSFKFKPLKSVSSIPEVLREKPSDFEKIKKDPVIRAISERTKPIGIFRRDVDKMSDLLRLRLKLLMLDPKLNKLSSFSNERHFDDLLLLLQLSSGEIQTAFLVDSWSSYLKNNQRS